jgi:hypothetical protein
MALMMRFVLLSVKDIISVVYRSPPSSGKLWKTNLPPKKTFVTFSALVTTVLFVMSPASSTGGT